MSIGHNNPPDPLDEALATDAEVLELAEGILTGMPVTSEEQMKQADSIAKRLKALKKAVVAAEESESKPLHDAWKRSKARFKPTIDDLDKQIAGCAAMVDAFKRKLAEEKTEAERKARAEAAEKARQAAELARQAEVSDIDAQREARAAQLASEEAQRKAAAASRDNNVKGLRTVTRYETESYRDALNWIVKNDRDAVSAFVDEYVRKNHKTAQIAGVKVWQEKEAF